MSNDSLVAVPKKRISPLSEIAIIPKLFSSTFSALSSFWYKWWVSPSANKSPPFFTPISSSTSNGCVVGAPSAACAMARAFSSCLILVDIPCTFRCSRVVDARTTRVPEPAVRAPFGQMDAHPRRVQDVHGTWSGLAMRKVGVNERVEADFAIAFKLEPGQ